MLQLDKAFHATRRYRSINVSKSHSTRDGIGLSNIKVAKVEA